MVAVDPEPTRRYGDPDPDWAVIVDRALQAGQVAVDAGERQRLVRILRRLAPVAAPAPDCLVARAGPAEDFARILQGLARG